MEMAVVGATIFAIGAFFGAWFLAAGQQLRSNRTRRKFQDAILKNLERAASQEGDCK